MSGTGCPVHGLGCDWTPPPYAAADPQPEHDTICPIHGIECGWGADCPAMDDVSWCPQCGQGHHCGAGPPGEVLARRPRKKISTPIPNDYDDCHCSVGGSPEPAAGVTVVWALIADENVLARLRDDCPLHGRFGALLRNGLGTMLRADGVKPIGVTFTFPPATEAGNGS